jgi:hypothetical protein
MLSISNLNVYFDGASKIDEENVAVTFHSNYNGEDSIHFSVNAEDISKLNENIDICVEDFKAFIKTVLATAIKE